MKLHLWGRRSLPEAVVTSDERLELEKAQEKAERQRREAISLLSDANESGLANRLSRTRNHYGLIVRDLYRGETT